MFRQQLVLTVVVTALTGCGTFGVKPIPVRLGEAGQQRYEYGWEHLVALGPEVDRTALLDTLLMGQVWHMGVDRLHLRSEKQVGDVRVVMETQFDRALPEEDMFAVTFYDAQGRIERREIFTPAEFDDALALYQSPTEDVENETTAEREQRLARLAELQSRLGRVSEVFPAPPEPPESDVEPISEDSE